MADDGEEQSPPPRPPVLASASDLERMARSRGLAINWVGPRQGFRYELTETPEGRLFVRYLPAGAKAGDPRAAFLAVGTYPQANAFAQVQTAARRKGAVSLTLPGGGLAVYNLNRPTSVYVGSPGVDYQVEVYHPDARVARAVAASGQVADVGGRGPSGERGPRAVSEDDLRGLAAFLQLPAHWAGPKAGFVLELTLTREGRVFVRYLPKNVAVGDPRVAFLTVGTYPQTNGFAAVRAAAKRKGAVSIELRDGGLAVYDRNRPTSIYLSHTDADYQVEVYHPDAREALRLVRSGQVKPVA